MKNNGLKYFYFTFCTFVQSGVFTNLWFGRNFKQKPINIKITDITKY